MEELWKPIPQFEDLYEVSTLGRVRCLKTRNWKWNQHEKSERAGDILPTYTNSKGYYQKVTLYGEGRNYHRKVKSRSEYVHRLVALAFIPNPDNKPQVDHIDTCTTNNEVTNLRWVTQSENNANPITSARNKATRQTQEYKDKMNKALSGEKNGANTHPEKNSFINNNPAKYLYGGTHYYNNGIEENRYHEGKEPEGWVRGRLPGVKYFGR